MFIFLVFIVFSIFLIILRATDTATVTLPHPNAPPVALHFKNDKMLTGTKAKVKRKSEIILPFTVKVGKSPQN